MQVRRVDEKVGAGAEEAVLHQNGPPALEVLRRAVVLRDDAVHRQQVPVRGDDAVVLK